MRQYYGDSVFHLFYDKSSVRGSAILIDAETGYVLTVEHNLKPFIDARGAKPRILAKTNLDPDAELELQYIKTFDAPSRTDMSVSLLRVSNNHDLVRSLKPVEIGLSLVNGKGFGQGWPDRFDGTPIVRELTWQPTSNGFGQVDERFEDGFSGGPAYNSNGVAAGLIEDNSGVRTLISMFATVSAVFAEVPPNAKAAEIQRAILQEDRTLASFERLLRPAMTPNGSTNLELIKARTLVGGTELPTQLSKRKAACLFRALTDRGIHYPIPTSDSVFLSLSAFDRGQSALRAAQIGVQLGQTDQASQYYAIASRELRLAAKNTTIVSAENLKQIACRSDLEVREAVDVQDGLLFSNVKFIDTRPTSGCGTVAPDKKASALLRDYSAALIGHARHTTTDSKSSLLQEAAIAAAIALEFADTETRKGAAAALLAAVAEEMNHSSEAQKLYATAFQLGYDYSWIKGRWAKNGAEFAGQSGDQIADSLIASADKIDLDTLGAIRSAELVYLRQGGN